MAKSVDPLHRDMRETIRETTRETTSEPGGEAPRTCGRQSGAAQERSLDNSVIKCF